MKSFSAPTPQNDELFDGIKGRLRAVNGCTEKTKFLSGLRAELDLPVSTPAISVWAQSVGLTPRELLFRHTLRPVHRAFSSHIGTEREERLLACKSSMTNNSMRSQLGALVCTACVDEQQAAGGPSYWRRAHHLPNVDWCPRHQAPLRRFAPIAFEVRPTDAICSMDCPRSSRQSLTSSRGA